MDLSPTQKSLITSICASSVLFGVSAIPLAIFGDQPIEVQVKNQTVLESEVSYLAGPYLAVSGAVCTALSFGIMGMSGWRSAANKSEAIRGKNVVLENNLLSCKAELERIKFSENRLKADNLGGFIRPEAPSPVNPIEVSPQSLTEVATHQSTAARHNQVASSNGNSTKNGLNSVAVRSVINSRPAQSANYPEEMSFLIHEGLHSNNGYQKQSSTKVALQEGSTTPKDHPNGSEKQLGVMVEQLKELLLKMESLGVDPTNELTA